MTRINTTERIQQYTRPVLIKPFKHELGYVPFDGGKVPSGTKWRQFAVIPPPATTPVTQDVEVNQSINQWFTTTTCSMSAGSLHIEWYCLSFKKTEINFQAFEQTHNLLL